MNVDDAHRRADALFKKEQQLREGQQAMAEYQAELRAMREKTARLRALRLARDAANQNTPPANQKGAAQLGSMVRRPRTSIARAQPTRRPAPARSAPKPRGRRSQAY
jgi:hypothetical protein